MREIEWNVTDYPLPMRGLLVLPLKYKTEIRYPLIVDIHGGGSGASMHLVGSIINSILEWQYWAAKGYAVFVPEFRSSAAFGSLAITRDQIKMHHIIDCDCKDIITGVDKLVNDGIVDKNRIIVLGQSAGARRVNWLCVSSNKFSAFISKEGWADEWTLAGIQDNKRIYNIYGGTPTAVPHHYQKNSSLFHAHNATTPTLFLMGNPQQGIDKYDTVRWLYNALKTQGISSQYIQYPDEGHNLEKVANQLDAMHRVMQWIETYIGKGEI